MRKFPEFLIAIKNDWVSVGALGKLIRVNGWSFGYYLQKRQDAGRPLKYVKAAALRYDLEFRKVYQVKQVVAAVWADGYEIHEPPRDLQPYPIPVSFTRNDPERKTNAAEIEQLRRDLVNAEQKIQGMRNLLKVASKEELVKKAVPLCASGIYFLIRNGSIVYVGQSINILDRIKQHVGVKEFDSVSWVSANSCDLNNLETVYIDAFAPVQNKIKPSIGKVPSTWFNDNAAVLRA